MKNLSPPIKFGVLTILAVVFTVLTATHVNGVNGPSYWRWPWRDLDPIGVYLIVLWAGAPVLVGVWLAARQTWLALFFILIGAAALQWGGAHINGPNAEMRIATVVQSVEATSYFNQALTLDEPGWLSDYPAVLDAGQHHARNKPPGPVWFYRTLLDLGIPDTALVGGVLVGALALLSVFATYHLGLSWGQSPQTSVLAAALMATAPGFLLFFPEFDQVLPAIGSLMLITWVRALKAPPGRPAIIAAALFGAALALALLWSYALLTLGLFLGLLTLSQGFGGDQWRTTAVQVVVALASTAFIHMMLWVLTGYDPIATFNTAYANQQELLGHIHRPWPLTIPFDILDLALGLGWITTALVVFSLTHHPTIYHQLAALSILGIIATGLLPGETARVLLFTVPLLAVTAAAELVRWPRGLQLATLALTLAGVAATVRTMTFIAA